MVPLTLYDIQLLIAASLFLLGIVCFITGTIILVTRGYSRELRMLAAHTARISQKGLAEEMAGLVSSASELVAAINQLVRTASGIGVFLVLLGLVMIVSSYWMVLQIEWPLG